MWPSYPKADVPKGPRAPKEAFLNCPGKSSIHIILPYHPQSTPHYFKALPRFKVWQAGSVGIGTKPDNLSSILGAHKARNRQQTLASCYVTHTHTYHILCKCVLMCACSPSPHPHAPKAYYQSLPSPCICRAKSLAISTSTQVLGPTAKAGNLQFYPGLHQS